MRLRIAIFDLDGTLLDTLADLANAMNRTLARFGFPVHPVDAYRTFVGEGVALLVERALPPGHRDTETREAALRMYREDYGRHWNVATRPYPGIRPMLGELDRRRFRLAVLSNKPDLFTRRCVDAMLPGVPFGCVLGQRGDLPRKPDPAGVKRILEVFGAPATEAVMIGDSGTDMDTARAAGIPGIGVRWGFRSEDELRAHGAAALADRPADLPELLDAWPAGRAG